LGAHFKFTFRYSKDQSDDTIICLKNGKRIFQDTVDGYGPTVEFGFRDFNQDGMKDFISTSCGNTCISVLYFFDSISKSFRRVNGFSDFPEALKIRGIKNLYYSYHHSGCADADWDSDLFTIWNFSCIHLANIHGLGCDDEEQMVVVSKINPNKKVLIVKLPIEVLDDFKDYKWGFIAEYWKKNWRKFVQ